MNTPPTELDTSSLGRCKELLWLRLQRLPGRAAGAALPAALAREAAWHVLHPVNERRGATSVWDGLYAPLQAAFADLERRGDLFFKGRWTPPPSATTISASTRPQSPSTCASLTGAATTVPGWLRTGFSSTCRI